MRTPISATGCSASPLPSQGGHDIRNCLHNTRILEGIVSLNYKHNEDNPALYMQVILVSDIIKYVTSTSENNVTSNFNLDKRDRCSK